MQVVPTHEQPAAEAPQGFTGVVSLPTRLLVSCNKAALVERCKHAKMVSKVE